MNIDDFAIVLFSKDSSVAAMHKSWLVKEKKVLYARWGGCSRGGNGAMDLKRVCNTKKYNERHSVQLLGTASTWKAAEAFESNFAKEEFPTARTLKRPDRFDSDNVNDGTDQSPTAEVDHYTKDESQSTVDVSLAKDIEEIRNICLKSSRKMENFSKELMFLKDMVGNLLEIQQQILQHVRPESLQEIDISLTKRISKAMSVFEFKKIEQSLHDPGVRTQVVKSIKQSQALSKDMSGAVRHFLRHFASVDTWKGISYKGHMDKLGFLTDFKQLHRLLRDELCEGDLSLEQEYETTLRKFFSRVCCMNRGKKQQRLSALENSDDFSMSNLSSGRENETMDTTRFSSPDNEATESMDATMDTHHFQDALDLEFISCQAGEEVNDTKLDELSQQLQHKDEIIRQQIEEIEFLQNNIRNVNEQASNVNTNILVEGIAKSESVDQLRMVNQSLPDTVVKCQVLKSIRKSEGLFNEMPKRCRHILRQLANEDTWMAISYKGHKTKPGFVNHFNNIYKLLRVELCQGDVLKEQEYDKTLRKFFAHVCCLKRGKKYQPRAESAQAKSPGLKEESMADAESNGLESTSDVQFYSCQDANSIQSIVKEEYEDDGQSNVPLAHVPLSVQIDDPLPIHPEEPNISMTDETIC